MHLDSEFEETERKSATYYRIIKWDDNSKTSCNTKVYRMDSSLLYIGGYENFAKKIYRDTTTNFYKNGVRSSQYTYNEFFKLTSHTNYFENGRLKNKIIYMAEYPDSYVNLRYEYPKNIEDADELSYYSHCTKKGTLITEKRYNPKDSSLKKVNNYKVIQGDELILSSINYFDNRLVHFKQYYSLQFNGKDNSWFSRSDSLYSYYDNGSLKRKEYFADSLISENKCFAKNGKAIGFTPFYTLASYPTGEEGLMNYLSKNIAYPRKASRKGIEGTVYVQFAVCTDGELCEFKVVIGVNDSMDEAVLKSLKRMPKWKPGKVDGNKVRTSFTLPVQFKSE